MPRVSVIIPSHNRPALLREALASVLAQTFGDWEAVVVDDGSMPPIALGNVDRRVRVVRHAPAQGGAAAKNAGIGLAAGEILAFLDDDDLWASNYLQRALDVLDRRPELDLVFIGVSWFGEASDWGQRSYENSMARTLRDARGTVAENGVVVFDEQLFDALLTSVPMAFQRPVVRSRAMRRIGLYRPASLLWDCCWAIRAALNGNTALITDTLYRQRVEGQGYSSKTDRQLEHLVSGGEMMERYLHEARAGCYPPTTVSKFRHATAKAWFDLAWYHYRNREDRKAAEALLRSERLTLSLPRLRLLIRLMLPTVFSRT